MPTKRCGKKNGANSCFISRANGERPTSRQPQGRHLSRKVDCVAPEIVPCLSRRARAGPTVIGTESTAAFLAACARPGRLLQRGEPGECVLPIVAAHFDRWLQAGAKTGSFGTAPEAAAKVGSQMAAHLAGRFPQRVTGIRGRDRRRNAACTARCPAANLRAHHRQPPPASRRAVHQPAALLPEHPGSRAAATGLPPLRASPAPSDYPSPFQSCR